MTDFENAKQLYHHQEYQMAIEKILSILQNSEKQFMESSDYPDILCYLGDSRLAIYKQTYNKSFIYEAISDYATAANSLLVHHKKNSKDLDNRLQQCITLF